MAYPDFRRKPQACKCKVLRRQECKYENDSARIWDLYRRQSLYTDGIKVIDLLFQNLHCRNPATKEVSPGIESGSTMSSDDLSKNKSGDVS